MPTIQTTVSRLAPLLLAGLALLVFWPGLHGGYIFDDFANLVEDPDWKMTSLSLAQLRRAMSLGVASDLGRPLALLSFGINHYLTGTDPFWLKLTGLCMHILNGLLVWRLCLRLFALTPARDANACMGRYAAALVALAWLLHPLQVSTALYVVQRMEVGAHTFVLLALLSYLRARTAGTSQRLHAGWLSVTGLCMLLGLGFKETALLIPGYTLLLEVCVLSFRNRDGRISQPLAWAYAAGAALGLAVFLLKILPDAMRPMAYALRNFTLGERLLTQLPVLTMYLGQMLWPLPSKLVFYYDNYPVSHGLLSPPATLYGGLILTGLVAVALLAVRRLPLITLGIAWFFIAHALTSNVIALELAFEHRNYFALLGILLAFAQGSAWLTSRLHLDARRTLATLAVALLVSLCDIQVKTWSDPFRLAMILESRNPTSPRATYALGKEMLVRAKGPSSALYSLAEREFEHSARLPGSSPLPEHALIFMAAINGKKIPPDLWQRLQDKLAHQAASPEYINALNGLLECRTDGACAFDDQQLFKCFVLALQHNPQSDVLHALYAYFAWNVMGDRPLAIAMMREAVRLKPSVRQHHVDLADYLRISAMQQKNAETSGSH